MLRPYQQRLNDRIRRLEQKGPTRILVQSPTGSGKTVCISDLLRDPVPQLLLTHRRVLLSQTSAVLASYGIEHGIRASGHAANHKVRIQLAIIPTEYNRAFREPTRWRMHKCTRVHVDEIHAAKGPTAEQIYKAYYQQGASLIYYTATPVEVGHLVDHHLTAATVRDLINQGYLVPPVYYAPTTPDLDRLEKVRRDAAGEFTPTELRKVFSIKAVFGHVVEHLQRLNPALDPTVLFAPGVPHSLWCAKRLTRAGIRAAHIDARCIWLDGIEQQSTPENRASLFARVEAGEVKVLCNRWVLKEGWDCPAVRCVVLATSFGSRAAFVQAAGRGLRPFPGKTKCVIIDHGGNLLRHPCLTDDSPWNISPPACQLAKARVEAMRNEEEPEPILCPSCACLRISGPVCPECGFQYEKQARIVLEVDGTLRRVYGKLYKKKPVKVHTAADTWISCFFAARKHRPHMTLGQVKRWAENKCGEELPFDLPLMPKGRDTWRERAGDVPFSLLRARNR